MHNKLDDDKCYKGKQSRLKGLQIMGIMLYKVVRDGLSDEMTFEQTTEVRAQALKILGIRML